MANLIPALALVSCLAAPQAVPPAATDATAALNHKEALSHFRAGLEKLRAESWEDAEHEFRFAIRLDPLMEGAYYGLGQSLMALRRYPEAVEAFLGCRKAHHELATLQQTNRALADQRRDDEIRELRDSIRLFQSGSAKSASPQNTILRLESRLQQLETERRKGQQSVETPAEISLALGSAYFRSGDLGEAGRAYEAAVRVNPKMGEAHNNLAVVYMLSGRLEEAEKEAKAAERAGYRVDPRFKADLKKARQAEAAPR